MEATNWEFRCENKKPVHTVASVQITTVMRQCSDNLVLVENGIVFKAQIHMFAEAT